MRLIRPAVAVAVGVSLVLAGSAGAAPKKKVPPVCNLVVDEKGDTNLEEQKYADPNLDVLGGDIASDGKVVTVVMRMDGVAEQDTNAPFGRTIYYGFNAPTAANQLYVSASFDPVLGVSYDFGDLQGNLYTSSATAGAATGAVDVAKKTITVTAPADLGGLTNLKRGTKITGHEIKAAALVGVLGGGLVSTVDVASGTKTYLSGAKSCVIPGKG